MPFDINQLNNLDYDEAEPLLSNYIDGVVEQFAKSPEGEAYVPDHPDFGGWIATFTEMSYIYEGFTLPKMTKANAQVVMEHIIPRKLTLMTRSEADDAISELVAFWNFLKREYNFRNAGAIAIYLTGIEGKFTDWMFDPAKGGMAKSFMMNGIQAGFNMTTQAGVEAFKQVYNQKILSEKPNNPLLQKLGSLFTGSSPEAQIPLSNSKSSKQKPKNNIKGFEPQEKGKKSKGKKR
ncbi:hypothetical protein VB713_24395 [Anabaena cylindrica UHCC 0172]|uniref:hypothetical protein n=1 Tax=Anabaena cylindrica TaxID=1165 RepID=UPI002B20D03E|nr:hypothetical protein [Anabaena cylindrica]MEA5554082.1 hypothetical protein [Anabaena cylindrica UHCC 0172]